MLRIRVVGLSEKRFYMARKKDTRLTILSVSAELFALKGKDAVGIREIAEKSSVSLNTIMYHFTSKDNLHYETISYVLENGIPYSDIFEKYSDIDFGDKAQVAEAFAGITAEIFSAALNEKFHIYTNMICKVIFSNDKKQLRYVLDGFNSIEPLFLDFFRKAGREPAKEEVMFLLCFFWSQVLFYTGARAIVELDMETEDVPEEFFMYIASQVSDVFLSKLGLA
jgi:AcrR family transcriptional regulator